jgi:hypothetical protein
MAEPAGRSALARLPGWRCNGQNKTPDFTLLVKAGQRRHGGINWIEAAISFEGVRAKTSKHWPKDHDLLNTKWCSQENLLAGTESIFRLLSLRDF